MANAKDLSRLMELAKKKAELEFSGSVLKRDTASELAEVAKAHADLAEKLRDAEIIAPNADKLAELQKTVAGFSEDELRDALKVRDGKAYHFLTERGRIVKRNFENRMEIAKLSVMVSKMEGGLRGALSRAIRKGELAEPIDAGALDEKARKTLVRLLVRCGIPAELSDVMIKLGEAEIGEVRMEVSNRSVWIGKGMRPRLEENVRRMREVNSVIQLRNAERQIKVFDSREEDEFSALQRQYLELLKEQDELLREYDEEERA